MRCFPSISGRRKPSKRTAGPFGVRPFLRTESRIGDQIVWSAATRWGRDQRPQFPPPDPHLLPSPPGATSSRQERGRLRLQALARPQRGEPPCLLPTAARLRSLRGATLGQPKAVVLRLATASLMELSFRRSRLHAVRPKGRGFFLFLFERGQRRSSGKGERPPLPPPKGSNFRGGGSTRSG